ncbi:hypothetical protein DUNSADRAFT_225 [Dunaliella salina]|uniref:Uncharacterized protein n=1 Tax=Dunaliella salina TaxID=3046 RepID=A0ABQ7GYP6_DUNSA|nr:hypothetical protein DUNSADRAFT_225 [Dunaliella salina]|eukprot:KAF5839674.1 hypothetical protein DUNSADRAFT_225 [Dunaliella salina]
MPKTQGSSIRFTSFGKTANSLSRNEGQAASNIPPTQNQSSRAPIGIEGFPPLPKRRGSAVLAVQEAEMAGASAAARSAAESQLQHQKQQQKLQQQQQQQQGRERQLRTHPTPSPLTAEHHRQEQHPGPGNAPRAMEGSLQLQMRCKSLEEQLQQHQQQANSKTSALAAGLHELLATLKNQGYEVAAGLDYLQDELYDDTEDAAQEEADVSLQQRTDASDNGANAHAGTHVADPPLDSLHTSPHPSSRGRNGEVHDSSSDAQPVSHQDASSSHEENRSGASGEGSHRQAAVDRRGQPPEKLVVLRAKRDHVEMEFIQLMRSSVAGLERLLNEIELQ